MGERWSGLAIIPERKVVLDISRFVFFTTVQGFALPRKCETRVGFHIKMKFLFDAVAALTASPLSVFCVVVVSFVR